MSPEAQRIAIAEACGFSHIAENQNERVDMESRSVTVWTALEGLQNGRFKPIPDYINDLNAMHEAEKVLNNAQHEMFCAILFFITNSTEQEPYPALSYPTLGFVMRATAAQRAEAFLRTLNLWDDSK